MGLFPAEWIDQGLALSHLGNHEDAISAFNKAIDVDTKNPAAWYYKCMSLTRLGRQEEANQTCDRALAFNPEDPSLWTCKGNILRLLGHPGEASGAFRKALEADPDNAVTWYNLGCAFTDLSWIDDATRAFDRALELNPTYVDVWVSKGVVYALSNQNEKALDAYERALGIDPDDASIWCRKGDALYTLGVYHQALTAYERAIELDPAHADAWNGKGKTLDKLDRHEEARSAYDRAAGMSPEDPRIRLNPPTIQKTLQPSPDSGIQAPVIEESREPPGMEIFRQYEFYGGMIRVKISVRNGSPAAVLDVMLYPEIDEKILNFDRYEPVTYQTQSGRILLGNILPDSDRTISLYLEPLICAKEGTDIHCLVRYKDSAGAPKSIQMDPLKIQVICPIFDTGQPVNIGQMKALVSALRTRDCRIYSFPSLINEMEVLNACRHTALLHDIWHISTLRKENMLESWYYGKTKVAKKDLVIRTFIDKTTNQLEITVIGDDPGDITGLLAEINRNLAEEFRKIGRLQNVYNITIKDSVIQRCTFLSSCDTDGTCPAGITVLDSVVQRSNFLGNGQDIPDE